MDRQGESSLNVGPFGKWDCKGLVHKLNPPCPEIARCVWKIRDQEAWICEVGFKEGLQEASMKWVAWAARLTR